MIIFRVTLSLAPSLTLQPLLHPQFECSGKVSETGYCLMKLDISSQDFAGLYFDKS